MKLDAHIAAQLTPEQPLTYDWSDWEARDTFLHDPPDDFAPRMGDSAALALVIGTSAWIRLRLAHEGNDPLVMQTEGMAWAYMNSPDAAAFFETNLDQWRGPVRGPLGIVVDILLDAMFYRDDDPRISIRMAWIYNLALHVMEADADAYVGWFADRAEALAAAYPPESGTVSLFGDDPSVGPAVDPDALLPGAEVARGSAKAALYRYLVTTEAANPLFDQDFLVPA